ncbi:MAG: hypothetical protein OXT07_11300 [bacterium]|nr:hypothetical protein [bacterium]
MGLAALAAVAPSCLPVGNASTSTYASIPAEDVPARDAGSTSFAAVVSAATVRGASSATGFEITAGSSGVRSVSGPAPAGNGAELSPPEATPQRVWLVAANEQAEQLAALGYQTGDRVIVASGDLRALPFEAREMISYASEVKVGPGLGEDAVWQLEAIRRGHQIPGGGLLMFGSGFDRRLVAIYGHPSGPGLGVLGEQSPAGGVERLRSIAQAYGADGSVILPAFEIIATVASAGAGGDGDYSAMTARDAIRPWIETAAANNMYVVLDLQPGRTDFLTQAKVYEEFLRLPHVGLALDPEWRLKPHQVHLEQVGTVEAAEINQVAAWLAGIVREQALPQKLLIVHQFQTSMIANRQHIDTPPELAVLIQMDGQGSMRAKYASWNTLTSKPDAGRFHWGWKNFYDEDFPNATPDQVLELTPTPEFVSFQ